MSIRYCTKKMYNCDFAPSEMKFPLQHLCHVSKNKMEKQKRKKKILKKQEKGKKKLEKQK